MTRSILIKATLSSIPLIAIAQAFFYLTNRSGLSEDALIYIKPFLYGMFLVFAIGLPIYFYFRSLQLKLLKMILVLTVSWNIFSIFMTISAFTIYPGLAKDIEAMPFNIAVYFFKWVITGTIFLSVTCALVTIISKWLLRRRYQIWT